MKRVLTLVLLLSMILTFAISCSDTGDSGTTGTSATTSTAPKPTSGTTAGTQGSNKPQTPSNPENDEPLDDGFYPVIRFAVASDTHITTPDGRQAQRTVKMLRQMNAYAAKGVSGYNKLDAVLIAGDVTDTGSERDLSTAYTIFFDNIRGDTELVVTSGNHEWNSYGADSLSKFESFFGRSSALKDTVINGYHFITTYASEVEFNMYGYEYSEKVIEETEKLIKAAIEDTGEDKPVFVIQHVGNMYTAGGTMGTDSSPALDEIYAKYDNLVVFSGHSHYPANDECSIYQKDYTAINTGTLNYTATGTKKSGKAIKAPNGSEYAQCYLIEIDKDNRMRVRCWDILQNKFVGEEWLVESWNKEDFVYTPDRFKAEDIFFAKDAKIEIFGIFDTGAVLNVPMLPEDSLPARAYEVKLFSENGSLISTEYTEAQYYHDKFDSFARISLTGLTKNTSYNVEVKGLNTLYDVEINNSATLYTEALKFTFKTSNGNNSGAADIIDLKIDGNTVTNGLENGYDPVFSEDITVVRDSTIGRDVLKFDGKASRAVKFDDYTFVENELVNSFTAEIYFKIDAFPASGTKAVLGAFESGGFGLEINSGKQALFSVFNEGTGKYQPISFACQAGVYYHVIAAYDGNNYSLYVNGAKVGSVAIDSFRFTKTTASKCIYLGADTHWNGEALNMSNCSVAGFKLYSYALDANGASNAYTQMTKK